ncbi:hypothetical protein BDQ17DRAFT_1399371 [Cyathus striatus]|nr:hypothetical protein BDQ17DRAFT_1399371 [Cyathus striatus]
MAIVSSPFHALESDINLAWTTTQEKSISSDFPFDLTDESADQYVARTYLQFLWLPDLIMPLHLFIPALRRVSFASTSSGPHPLHALLEPLLLMPRTASSKYQVDLPQLLAMGGGDGDMEETMMWFGLTHEKRSVKEGEAERELWEDEEWRKGWLERMERREVQIQILLYFLKLSLPGPLPPSPVKKKRKRKESSVPSYEERLETFMDKLSTWQLLGSLGGGSMPEKVVKGRIDTRDCMQVFWETMVEPLFKDFLPDLVADLRTKIFPVSLFSDDVESIGSRSPSPTNTNDSRHPAPRPFKRAPSRASTVSRFPSPALSAISTTNSRRSRSLSVSLAQEKEERERATSVGGPNKKRVLNREVSMSRVFRPKPKPERVRSAREGKANEEEDKGKGKKKDVGVTLVEETPQKPKLGRAASTQDMLDAGVSQTQSQTAVSTGILTRSPDVFASSSGARAHGQFLFPTATGRRVEDVEMSVVEETPVKTQHTLTRAATQPSLQPLFPARVTGMLFPPSNLNIFDTPTRIQPEEEDGEAEWPPESSPDLLLLRSGGGVSEGRRSLSRSRSRSSMFGEEGDSEEDEDEIDGFNVTPSKPRRKK